MIDSEGYRPNVGIILCNSDGRLFWGKRIGQHSWQFPQGGIRRDESPEQAMFRELAEEVGLRPEHVQVIGCTKGWLRYRLPKRLIRHGNQPTCIGQKQVWFLLRMVGGEDVVCLDASERPEFDHWQWVDYWYPLRAVVPFKRHVYWRALHELAPLLFPVRLPKRPFSVQSHDRAMPERPAHRRLGFDPLSAPMRTLGAAMEVAKAAMDVAMEATLATVRPSEPARPAAVAKPASVLPLRQVETCPHPVITRMVISARRDGVLEPLTVVATPAREAAAAAPMVADKPRSPRPPASCSRRVSRR